MKTPQLIRPLLSLAVALGLLFAPPAFADDEPQSKTSRAQWEHLAFNHVLQSPQTNADVAREIVRLGKEGWELVSVANFSESGTTTKTTYYFKRRL